MGLSSKSSFSFSADEQANLQKDLGEIARRLSEFGVGGSGDAAGAGPKVLITPSSSVVSPFVSGLRGKTTTQDSGESDRAEGGGDWSSGGGAEQKLKLLESVLQRLTELDRFVLKKTAPEADPDKVVARRSSRGFDLVSLPTHLHLMDRLMDLHSQSKRVTVIRTTAPGGGDSSTTPAPPAALSPRGAKLAAEGKAEKLAAEVARLSKQLEESVDQRKSLQEDCSSARRDANAAKKEVEALKRLLEDRDKECAASLEASDRWQQLLKQEQELSRRLTEQVETMASTQQAFIAGVSSRCHKLDSNVALSSPFSSTAPLPSDVAACLAMLDSTLDRSSAQLREQLESVLSVKDSLESELYSQQTRCDLMQKDLEATSRELDAVRGAHKALEMEAVKPQQQQQQQQQYEQQARLADGTISELTGDLARAHRRIKDLEKVVESVVDIEARLSLAEEAKASLKIQLQEACDQNEAERKISESLKAKLRELSSKGGKDKDFLDSYEEVMRDEMLSMKEAFERKLRAVKDEADASSRRNAELIKSLSTERLLAAKR